jgi:hypothetical protein
MTSDKFVEECVFRGHVGKDDSAWEGIGDVIADFKAQGYTI